MKKQEEYRIKVEISNKKRYYPAIIFMIIAILGLIAWAAKTLFLGIILFITLSLIILTVFYIANRFEPSDSTRVFIITKDDRLLYHPYYREGIGLDEFEEIRLSKVWKVVLKNKRIKWIDLWRHDNPDRPCKILTAPFLEKCNEEWQRLFDIICQRIPPDAEVIVK